MNMCLITITKNYTQFYNMGGNALKHICRRYTANEYHEIKHEIIGKLKNEFSKIQTAFGNYIFDIKEIPSYRNKESFGDMDILVGFQNYVENRHELILNTIKKVYPSVIDIQTNSNIYSFNYNKLQVDLIFVHECNFNSTYSFLSWNDLGNLIGRIAHKLGLSYGMEGLKYIYRSDDKIFGEFVVSHETKEIFQFLGLNYNVWLNGFDDLDSIFKFVVSSKYFCLESFDETKFNSTNKRRNEKRPTFQKFVDWLQLNNVPTNFTPNKDKSVYIDLISAAFPLSRFKSKLIYFDEKAKRSKLSNEKFNANMIMDKYPNLRGKELGNAISNFKQYICNAYGSAATDYAEHYVYNSVIINTDIDTIWSHFEKSLIKE